MYKHRGFHIAVLFLFILLLFYGTMIETGTDRQNPKAVLLLGKETGAGITADLEEIIFQLDIRPEHFKAVPLTPEERALLVYTFLQGPRAFREKWPWSGDWCEKNVSGNSFGGFGCGLCCMANIYSTLSNYECSPWNMYEFATQASLYYPSSESGAIGWEDMKTTLSAAGFACDLCAKPLTYEEFQEQMKHIQSAVVLISSTYDSTFWQDTPGHYVNIWLYREDTDMVFLAEPGNPEKNRTWIPLRYVYDALKMVSPYQYLAVSFYAEEANIWKWNGITDNWNGKY